ncbi:MAG TPA: PIG-L deacetylase family protein [Bryobacteraceae bacterium]|nr:PIG-L deacetylase family protein [Bryobacteraceae bacterium]
MNGKFAGPSRRSFLAGTALAAQAPGAQRAGGPRLRVVCVGGHPDDPESGCGGTLARYAEQGHSVTIIYLTRGEAGIPGKSAAESAAIRSAEAEKACRILGARPVFAGQIDGATEFNRRRVEVFGELLLAQQPDVVLTHWPVDSHMDHQVASLLVYRTFVAYPQRFSLYYFEVNLGSQTMGFHPTHYVDITATRAKKKAALYAHASQDPEGIYRKHHEIMENFRGRESGVAAAESFVHLDRVYPPDRLPG